MPTATFFLSTGRCGTQWLTDVLQLALGNRARIEHEPLHNDYAPRQMLGANDPVVVGGRCARRVAEHVDRIERTLESRDYIETGHPCWSTVPWLMRRFTGRVRIVHLVRHPVPTACSWLSHGAFIPPLLPTLPGKELISPRDAAVRFPEYADVWPGLTAYEKCLVYWAEVNAVGVEREKAGECPFLRVRYEDMFDPAHPAMERVLECLGGGHGALDTVDRGRQIDEHRFQIDRWPDLDRIRLHPRIVALAETLGYRATDWDAEKLAARFR